jgi:hypothetical protein
MSKSERKAAEIFGSLQMATLARIEFHRVPTSGVSARLRKAPEGIAFSPLCRESAAKNIFVHAESWQFMKTPGGWIAPGRRALIHSGGVELLDHPEHDGADKGDGCIRGNNAYFADQRTQQGHREISVVYDTARSTPEASKAFPL